MKFFVTGGAGFIGSELVNCLAGEQKVIVFDEIRTKKPSLTKNHSISVIKGDIRQKDLYDNLSDVDIIIHLAAKISVQESITNPKETFSVNVDGTKNLLDSCIKKGIKKIIVTSTAAVYGNCKNLPISENDKTNPISPYGQSKLEMENLLKSYSQKYDLDSIILRPFNVYGPGQSPEYAGVISKFIENIRQNKPLVIYGDGSYTRDFIHVDDVVCAFANAISHIDNKRGETYNIASGNATSIKSVAEMLLEFSGKKLDIVFKPQKQGDIQHSQADISKAKKELDFSPKTSLKDGLKSLLE